MEFVVFVNVYISHVKKITFIFVNTVIIIVIINQVIYALINVICLFSFFYTRAHFVTSLWAKLTL
jgi:hypothetical protein